MTIKLFADMERKRRELEQRDMEERKRKRETEMEAEEKAKVDKEWQKNFEESRQGIKTGFNSLKNVIFIFISNSTFKRTRKQLAKVSE